MRIERRHFLSGLGVAIATVAAGGGFAASRLLDGAPAPAPGAAAGGAARPSTVAAKATVYSCSMHPQIRQDHAGSCPICGMTLVRAAPAAMDATATATSAAAGASASASAPASALVHVDAATQQRMGLQLATASVADMARPIRAYASIAADASGAVSVNPKVEGWIRRLHVRGVGQPVRKNQLLYEIYSPELQQRQREYLDLLTRREGLLGDAIGMVNANSAMVGSLAKEKFRARERLIAADMDAALVAKLELERRVQDVVAVRAARDGVVTALGAGEGSYVNPAQNILVYADNRSVWAEVTLFPDQLAWLKNGDRIVLRSGLDKQAAQQARVDLATLQIDPATRSATLRLALDNPRGAFRPGAYAEAEIFSGAQRALSVPRDAVIRTGHGDFVVLAEANNHFRSARVGTGIENDDNIAIVSGLKAGDRVAVNGQFLLDGEASMQALQARLDGSVAMAMPDGAGERRP